MLGTAQHWLQSIHTDAVAVASKMFFDKQRGIEVQKSIDDAVAKVLEECDLLDKNFGDSDMESQSGCAALYPRLADMNGYEFKVSMD